MKKDNLIPWFPIHLHYLPTGLLGYPIKGAIICIETNFEQIKNYYNYSVPQMINGQLERIKWFLSIWPNLCEETPFASIPIFFSIEGECDFGDLSQLKFLKKCGLFAIQLYHWESERNPYLTSSQKLSFAGKELLRAMAYEGLILDLSHLYGPPLELVLNHYTGRRIISHVVCSSMLQKESFHRPNALSVNELLSCNAELYGVPFIDDLLSRASAFCPSERDVNIKTIADHIIAMIKIVGINRVALGPDFFDYNILSSSGILVAPVPESDTNNGLVQLAGNLMEYGLSVSDIESIFWKNSARVTNNCNCK